MRKLALAATLAFALTGFASTAFAGDANYILETRIQNTEKRTNGKEKAVEKPQALATDCCEATPKKENK